MPKTKVCAVCGAVEYRHSKTSLCEAMVNTVTNEIADIRSQTRFRAPHAIAVRVIAGMPKWRWEPTDNKKLGMIHARKALNIWVRLQMANKRVNVLRAKLGYSPADW